MSDVKVVPMLLAYGVGGTLSLYAYGTTQERLRDRLNYDGGGQFMVVEVLCEGEPDHAPFVLNRNLIVCIMREMPLSELQKGGGGSLEKAALNLGLN